MYKSIIRLLMLAVVLLFTSCDAEQQYNSHYPCNFIFYIQHHPESSLSKVNETNPGFFVAVEVKRFNGINTVYCTPNIGDADAPLRLTNEVENNRLSYTDMGAGGRLIIGCTTLNGLRAYDGMCPVCLENGSSTNYPLQFIDNGKNVKCSRCSTVFSLNNDGISIEGSQSRLLQYHFLTGLGYDQTQIIRITN